MKKLALLLVLSLPSFSSWALYECPEHGRVILSSAPCDTTFAPFSRFQGESVPPSQSSSSAPASIRLLLNSSNSYTVPGSVQGVPAVFTVDTGASNTAISSRVAASAGLSRCASSSTVHTANGSLQVCSAVASSIIFGPFRANNIAVTVMPNMAQDVLLGMDVLRNLKLDQRAGVLVISD